jgi:LysR family transcriptional regulator for metE and metH
VRIESIPATSLEVRDLRLVMALARTRTTKAGAELLHLAQPSVSRALLSLEERLGVRIFERTPHGLELNEAGARLHARAPELLGALRELERSLRGGPEVRACIDLVCECHTAYHWLPSVLRTLATTQPHLELRLRIEHTQDPLSALHRGEVSAALMTSPVRADAQLEVEPLFADETVFLVSAAHPLAKRKHLSPRDLRSHRLMSSPPTPSEARWFMRTVFGRARPRLQLQTIPLTEAIVELARAGLGIGILSEWMSAPYLAQGDLVARRLAKGPLRRPWSLVWRKELGAAGEALHQALVLHGGHTPSKAGSTPGQGSRQPR